MSKYSLIIHTNKQSEIVAISALAEIVTHKMEDSGLPADAAYAIEWLLSQIEVIEKDDPDSDDHEEYGHLRDVAAQFADSRKVIGR